MHVEELYSSGADEIKINVECSNRDIFHRVCPNLNFDEIIKMLEFTVDIFWKKIRSAQ